MTIKIIKYLAAIILLVHIPVSAQYQIECGYLADPVKAKGYVDSCASFWLQSYDTTYGGFYENVRRNGINSGTSKTMLGNSRTAYAMARAFMLTGETTYLDYARGALDFNYEHAWDVVNKGWFNEMDREGSILSGGSHNNDKWSFMQHYALLGISAMVDATQNEIDWQFLIDGRSALDDNLWDSRSGYEGYFDNASVDWSNPYDKGFTPTMDGITTHVLNLYLLTGENKYKDRLLKLADNVIDYMLPTMNQFAYGYPEQYSSNWNPVLSNTYVFTGHFLKSAWCLTRAYLIEPKPEYLNFSTIIINEVLEKGYDHEYGGCYKEYNGLTGDQYGTDKEWWELEQAFTACIMNYYISKDDYYLEIADETLEFFMDNFVDREYGEVYQTTTRTGNPITSSKASYWKAGYHSIELGYYLYLYGNLYVHNRPVELYYKFAPTDSDREIKLYPLAIEDNKLKVSDVRLDGDSYTGYVPDERILMLPSGTGGIFKVTFENSSPSYIASEEMPERFELKQNYPNPFNPGTTIEYSLNSDGPVVLEIYDISGQKLKTLVNNFQSIGHYNITWNGLSDAGSKVSSGIYFYRLHSGRYIQTRQMILLR